MLHSQHSDFPFTSAIHYAGGAARGNYTDKDIVDFLVNVECLEGQFDTWGAFGRGFLGDLAKGGPTPIGAQKANLSATNLPYMEEVALNEQVMLFPCCSDPNNYMSESDQQYTTDAVDLQPS